MQRRACLLICAAAAVFAVTGCNQPGTGPGTLPSTTTAAPATTAPTGGTVATAPPPPKTEPTAADVEYKVSYDWKVPSTLVTIRHDVRPPIANPPLPPLPYLVGIYTADHPEAMPKYQRISFYFRGAFPGYHFQYVKQVLDDAKGTPVTLPGNAKLSIVFVDAQAHDNAGSSTITASPKHPLGFQNLKDYGFAGDFEGHVSFGLGIQVAPGSDQALPIRAGELKKPDGSGGFFYVVHFDVRTA
jgi:hypothetical protein